jgi:hypothetical protein
MTAKLCIVVPLTPHLLLMSDEFETFKAHLTFGFARAPVMSGGLFMVCTVTGMPIHMQKARADNQWWSMGGDAKRKL